MYFKLLTMSLVMVIGATELAVPEVSNRTAKSVSVYVLDPVSYPPFDGRIGPQFSPYDRPVEYANYVNQFVSHPEEYFQRNTQPDAVASQIRKHDLNELIANLWCVSFIHFSSHWKHKKFNLKVCWCIIFQDTWIENYENLLYWSMKMLSNPTVSPRGWPKPYLVEEMLIQWLNHCSIFQNRGDLSLGRLLRHRHLLSPSEICPAFPRSPVCSRCQALSVPLEVATPASVCHRASATIKEGSKTATAVLSSSIRLVFVALVSSDNIRLW